MSPPAENRTDRSVPDELPDGVLEQLLDDLEAPKDRLGARRGLRLIFTIVRVDHAIANAHNTAKSKRNDLRRELKGLAKAVARVRAKIDQLSDPAQTLLALEAGSSRHVYFCSVIDHILAASAYLRPKARKKGRRSKKFNDPDPDISPLDELVYLLYVFAGWTGWHVRVDPGERTGTLVDFLRRAEPYLPEGFVPPDLWDETSEEGSLFKGWKRLQRIGTELRRPPDDPDGMLSELSARLVAAARQRRSEK